MTCSLGVGCEEFGVCYAAAHDRPDMCGAPIVTNPCELKDKCGWDGKSVGCTLPGCFGPAIFRLRGTVE